MSTTINATMNTSGQYQQSVSGKIEQLWEKVKIAVNNMIEKARGFFSMSTVLKAVQNAPEWVVYTLGWIGLWLYNSFKNLHTSGVLQGMWVAGILLGIFYTVSLIAQGFAFNLALMVAIIVVTWIAVYAYMAMLILALGLTAYAQGAYFVNIMRSVIMARVFFTEGS